MVGGTKGPVTLDADKNIVLHIQNKETEKVKATATLGSESVEKVFTLSGLTLQPQS